MKSIKNVDLNGKRVLVRVDFNVPLDEQHKITDDIRIQNTLPTIRYIIGNGGSAVLMSHMGRPKGEYDNNLSLKHLLDNLKNNLKTEIKFADDCTGEEAFSMAKNLRSGELLLLENLRFKKGEKEGDEEFARKLAGLADIYVNDAFGAAHRAHSSVSIVPKYFKEKYAGLLLQKEVEVLNNAFIKGKTPKTLVLGGAKIGDKIGIIENLLDKVDNILIGGAMAFTFIKSNNGKVGDSKIEEDKLDKARQIQKAAEERNVNFYLPEDAVVTNDISDPKVVEVVKSGEIDDGRIGVDIGAEARDTYSGVIETSKTIIWNGPMGYYERDRFATATKQVAEDIAMASENGAYSVIGGGDTTVAVTNINVQKNISHISTGGGAMLKLLAGEELPGIKALASS